MKGLFLFLAALISMVAHGQTSNVDRLNVRENMRIGGVLITTISSDVDFNGASNNALPTQAAVKEYVGKSINPIVTTIAGLTGYNGNSKTVILTDNVQAGTFRFTTVPQTVDSGIVFPALGGYFVRDWDGFAINPRWYGAKGDGVTDDSRALIRIINRFKDIADQTGITIQLTRGTYVLGDISVPDGFKISADQSATNNVYAKVPVIIKPAPDADYIFDLESAAMNVVIENLYIDADYQNNPNLKAAIRMRGTFNRLMGCNIIFCPGTAVWCSAGAVRIEKNNLQGNFAPDLIFTGPEDFRATLFIPGTGDSYIKDNEVGAGAPYLAGQVADPADILRDPIHKRVVAIYAGYLGNSYVENNLFENGDQGAVINGCFVGHYKGNRYEMNGFRGLRLRATYNSTFTNEHFTNNSLALNGQGEDLRLDTGSVAFCTFEGLTFVRATHPAIPTSSYKVKFNVVNYSGAGGNTMISPSFADTSAAARYDSLGHYDNTIQANPFRFIEGQYDPKNVAYNSVIAGGNGNKDPYTNWQFLGGIKLNPGTTTVGGNYTGSLSMFDASNAVKSSIGLDAGNDLTFNLFTVAGRYNFNNGEGFFNKNGAAGVTIQSNDGLGNPYLNWIAGTKSAGFTLDHTTGDLSAITSGGFTCTTGNGSPFTFINGNATFAKAGGLNVSVISDNTGSSLFQLSSDVVGTRAYKISFDNVTGNATLTATGNINVGLSNNWRFAANGINYIPKIPNPATVDTTFDFVVRTHSDGEVQYRTNSLWDSTTIKNRIANGAITSINSLTGPAISITTGTAGTDFNISNASNNIVLNIPDATSAARGFMTTGNQGFAGTKTFQTLIASSSITCTSTTANFYSGSGGGGTATTSSKFLYSGAGTTYIRVGLGGGGSTTTLAANASYASVDVAQNDVTTAATGTHPFIVSLQALRPNITYAGATVANSANFFSVGTPTGATNNYNTYIDSGNVALMPTQGGVAIGSNAAATSKLQITGSTGYSVTSTATNITLGEHNILRITTGGNTITLPTASSCQGREYRIRNEAAGTQTISAVLIDGVSTTTLPANTFWDVYSDGTVWRLLSRSN